jgi:cytochrome c biogenesis factor
MGVIRMLARIRAYIEAHPDISTWIGLAAVFLAILAWSARDMDLTTRAWSVLAVATVSVAGLCAWIISWEAGDETIGEQETSGAPEEDRVEG